jgi:hypothetical protein
MPSRGPKPAKVARRAIKWPCAFCSDGDASRDGGTCSKTCADKLKAHKTNENKRGAAVGHTRTGNWGWGGQ